MSATTLSAAARTLLTWGVLFGLVVSTPGCDERERTNPLDPENGDTGGTPDWLVATAQNRSVRLSWVTPPANGFEAFELFRAVGEDEPALLTRIADFDSTTVVDSAVVNGTDYSYRLDLVLDDSSRVVLPAKLAMPGSAVPWVVESGAFGVLRYSPDGRRARARTGSGGGAFDIAVSPDGEHVWAADYFAGEVQLFADSGAFISLVDVRLPYRIAVDHTRDVIWAASWALGTDPILYALARDGSELARFVLREEARDLVVDEASGACYVALGRGGGIARAVVGDTLRTSAPSETIMMLALAPGGRVYGGDPLDGGVFGYDPDTLDVEVSRPDLASPQSMTYSAEGLWVADGSERLVLVDDDLVPLRELPGVGLATGMAADAETGTIWLALPTSGRVYRVDDTDGEVVTSIPLFQPFAVALGRADTPGPRSAAAGP